MTFFVNVSFFEYRAELILSPKFSYFDANYTGRINFLSGYRVFDEATRLPRGKIIVDSSKQLPDSYFSNNFNLFLDDRYVIKFRLV